MQEFYYDFSCKSDAVARKIDPVIPEKRRSFMLKM